MLIVILGVVGVLVVGVCADDLLVADAGVAVPFKRPTGIAVETVDAKSRNKVGFAGFVDLPWLGLADIAGGVENGAKRNLGHDALWKNEEQRPTAAELRHLGKTIIV